MGISPNSTTVVTTREPFIVCWGAVFAGAAFALASAWILYLLGSVIGLSLIDPYAQDPTGGLGIGAIAWIFLTWVISLFLGGLLAGRLSETADRAAGLAHGILVWSVCIILTIVLSVMGVTTLFQAGGKLVSGITSSTSVLADSIGTKATNSLDTTPKGTTTLALESDIKQQMTQLASNTQQGQANNGTARAVTQLNNDQLMQVAGYLLQGNVDAAKNVLALNSNLSMNDINTLINNLNNKVDQYKQTIKAYADKAAAYTATALLIILMSNLFSLLACIIGGWIGIHTVSRVYGKTLY